MESENNNTPAEEVLLPESRESEQAVLGAILIDPEILDLAVDMFQGDEFYGKEHRKIFKAMRALADEGKPVDLVLIVDYLQETGELEAVGGVSYLAELANAVPTTANFGYYAGIVKEKHFHRNAILELQNLRNVAKSIDNPADLIAKIQERAAALADQAAPAKAFRTIGEVARDVFESIELMHYKRPAGGITGTRSGFIDLDTMTSGFQRQDMIIVGARPSVGKTAFALNVAQNVAVREQETVAIFSLEMGAQQLVQRMICAEGNIDANRMKTGMLEGDEWEKITLALGSLSEAPIYIDDSPSVTVHDIRSKCRKLKKESGLRLILIDYLQLIVSRGRSENRQQEISEISRTLKQIARELDVTVIALSQLSRAVEQRQDKRPMMSDLRESGSIEQDADIVAFLYRDDYYNKESEKKNIIEIILAKQRNGPVGTVELAFMKNYNKFVNLDRSHMDQARKPDDGGSPIPDMWRRPS